MAAKRHSIEYLREVASAPAHQHDWRGSARPPYSGAGAASRFFDEQGFLLGLYPLITASDTEGAGVFRVSTLDLENAA